MWCPCLVSAGGKAARLRRSTSGPKLAVMVEEDGGQPRATQQLIRALSPSNSEPRHGACVRKSAKRTGPAWKVSVAVLQKVTALIICCGSIPATKVKPLLR